MPLRKGRSQKVLSANIRELHTGDTYRGTARKYGKEVANKQAIAIAMRKAGKSKKGK